MDTQEYESIAWKDSKVEKPPPEERVLMWYKATHDVNAWGMVDEWQNRIIRKPDYWAWVHPPRI